MSRPKLIGPLPSCSFNPCHKVSRTKGLCEAHYQQKRKTGILKPLWEGRRNIHTLDDLLRYTTANGDCLIWDRSTTSSGYGFQTYCDKSWPAHRLAFWLANGKLDITGLTVHHKCAVKLCINPMHLELATQAENVLEMHARKGMEAEIKMLRARVAELEAEVTELRGVTILR